MDVFITRWLEKTIDFPQIVAQNIAGKVSIIGVVAICMAFPLYHGVQYELKRVMSARGADSGYCILFSMN